MCGIPLWLATPANRLHAPSCSPRRFVPNNPQNQPAPARRRRRSSALRRDEALHTVRLFWPHPVMMYHAASLRARRWNLDGSGGRFDT
jgi:hypothetical protein